MIRLLSLVLLFVQLALAHKMQENYLHIQENNQKVSVLFEIETRLLENDTIDDSKNGIVSFKELYNHQKELLDTILPHIRLRYNTTPLDLYDAKVTFHRYKSQTYMQLEKDFQDINIADMVLDYDLFFDKEPNHKLLIKVAKHYDAIIDKDKTRFGFGVFYMTQFDRFVLFIKEGIEHILDGIDHLLFILMILIPSIVFYKEQRYTKKETFIALLKIVTAFSVAHSITLFLAGMKIYIPNPTFIESAIAFSIFVVAFLNFIERYGHVGIVIVFLFGLIHGFGFANVLEIAQVKDTMEFIVSLLGFNVGVELGQIGVIAAILPFMFILLRFSFAKSFLRLLCFLTMIIAAFWFFQRLGMV